MKKKGIVFLIIFLVAGILAFTLMRNDSEKTQKIKDDGIISGVLETDEVDVNVKVAGKILEVKVDEGDNIKKGDIIATVEAENIETKLEQAKALVGIAQTRVKQAEIAYNAAKEQSDAQILQANGAYSAAQAQLKKAQKGARPQQLQQAQELVTQAKEGYEYAKVSYDRIQTLFKEGAISQQKLDGAKAEYEVAKSKYNTAKEQYNLVKEGAQKEDISAAEALVSQAEGMVNLAGVTKLSINARAQDVIAAKEQLLQAQGGVNEILSYLNDSTIKSPKNGTITSKNAEDGELVSTGMPVVTIADLKEIWANIKISENYIGNFKVGDTVDVYIPGENNKVYKGKITTISSKPSYATERASQEKGEKDVVAFTVKIKLDNSSLRLKPGMTASIKVKTK